MWNIYQYYRQMKRGINNIYFQLHFHNYPIDPERQLHDIYYKNVTMKIIFFLD